MSRAREFADLAGAADAGGITGKNMVVNGSMAVSQRGDVTGKTGDNSYGGPDRYSLRISNIGTWSMSQSSTAPDGFANSYKVDCTTADASPAASDRLMFTYRFEGQDVQQLQYGTSSAKSVTLSFYVRSNKTGTYVVDLFNHDPSTDRHCAKTYTISSADTWEYKTITFAGDTSQGFDDDNGRSLDINWFLGAGTDFTSGTLATSFADLVNANRAAGQTVNLADSTDNEWLITGVQLEVGSTATDFDHSESYGETLAKCQRYFEKQGAGPDETTFDFNFKSMPVKIGHQSSYVQGSQFAVAKRADPTVVIYSRNVNSGKVSAFATGLDEGNNWSTNAQGKTGFHAVIRDAGTHTVGAGFEYGFTADAEL